MDEFLVNLGFGLGLATALLTFIDIVLNAKQKKWIVRNAETLWIWLDDQRAGKFINVFLQKKFQSYLLIFAGTLTILHHYYFFFEFQDKGFTTNPTYDMFDFLISIIWEVVSVVIAIYVLHDYLHPRFLMILTKHNSPIQYSFFIIAFTAAFGILFYLGTNLLRILVGMNLHPLILLLVGLSTLSLYLRH